MTREEIVKAMSLQDAIEVLKDTNTYGTADIAKSVAIDTMRKYQKIEKIVNEWKKYKNGISSSEGDSVYMYMVSEVIENGNKDN